MRWTSPRLTSALSLGLALAILTPSRAEAAGSASRHATRIQVAPTGNTGAAQVIVSFTAAPTFSARLDKQRKRLIIDVPDADIRGAPGAVTKHAGVIGGVLAQTFDNAGSKTTRVLVTLLKDAKYSVSVRGTKLVVVFKPGKLGVLDEKKPITLKAAEPEAPTGVARVSDVRFEHKAGQDDVVIDLSQGVRYRLGKSGKNRARLVLDGASLPKALTRTLDATAFGGTINAVSSYAPDGSSDEVVIEVEAGESENHVAKRGNSLVWSFYKPGALPSSVTGVARDGGVARKTRTVYVEPEFADIPKVHDGYAEGAVERTAGDEAAAVSPGILGQARGRYTGRRVDLDLKDADVHNVLRLLADVGRVNIVTADNVSGSVTIRMRNVPWDQALDVVLQAKGLGMVRQGNMIRVAPLSDLEKEREMAIARRKQEMQLAPIETRLIPVSYANAGDIQARAKDLLSRTRDHRGRRAHQRDDRARRRWQPEPDRRANAVPGHSDTAGARRSAHRGGYEPLSARRRHSVGR